jgi:Flp pilus assembly protein TadD
MDFSPGALAATFVSTDARTFKEPPANWMPTNVNDRAQFFAGSPQSLVGDLIREGATGVAGQVSEPYLESAVRPEILFPAYLSGFNLIESFYMAIPHLSWQTVVVGDPLCAPFARKTVSRSDIDGGIDPELELPAFFAKRRLEVATASMSGASDRVVRLIIRAETQLSRGERAMARRLLEQATQLSPDLARPHQLLAELLTLEDEKALAAEHYRRLIAIQPNNVIALNNLAYDMAVREKKPSEALPLALKAQALAPRDATILDTVGWVQYLLGNTAEAAKLLVQASRGAAGNADIRLHTAFALASQGARAAAQAELEQALKLAPSFEKRPDVQELKARLDSAQN